MSGRSASRQPWYLRGKVRYVAAAALMLDLGVGLFSTAMAVTASSAPAPQSATTSSAVTVAWTANRHAMDPDYKDAGTPDPSDDTLDPNDPNQQLFKNLSVTVSQTQNLTDQGLQVSWTGGRPTSPGGAASDYLQIMQCWGSKGASGPTPEQCQWGTPNASLAAQTGTAASSRLLMTHAEADPKQDLGAAYSHQLIDGTVTHEVPFWSINDPGKKSLGWTSDPYQLPPFGPAQSNEVTYARTASDGTGRYIVNLQSAITSPYLGCGDPTYMAQGKTCWLVVVPRGEYDVNGQLALTHDDTLPQNSNYVDGSPLSASVWQDRIQIPLSFTPVGSGCPLTGTSDASDGTELVASAVASWRPALCRAGVNITYSRLTDQLARGAVTAGSPSLDFMADPVEPTASGGAKLAYAPVATSGIVITYLIDKAYINDKSNPDFSADGTLVTDLRLTPRLVAKLLTQSYRSDTPGDGGSPNSVVPATNPESLRNDPEFLALNPEFKYFPPHAGPDGLIVPFGNSDAAKAIWTWLQSDSSARAFLAGKPDPWGMTINPAYKNLDLSSTPMDSFPKADPSTYQYGGAPAPGYGTLDLRPYSSTYTDGAVRTVTASAGQKITWDDTKVPPQYTGPGPQTPGSRFEMAITTSQAAALYGLPTASLVADASDVTDPGVSATADAMAKQAASASVATSVPGVESIDPGTWVDGGYPLTLRTYAAVNICAATIQQLRDYAAMLGYVDGQGQVQGSKPGELPYGYAPLSATDKSAGSAAAAKLLAEVKDPQCASHRPSSAPSTTPTTQPTATPSTGTTSPTGAGPSGTGPAGTGPAGTTVPAGTSSSLTPQNSGTAPAAAPSGAIPPAGGSTPSSPATATVAGDAPPGGLTPAAYVTPALRYALLAALCFALPCLILGPRLIFVTRRRT